jgi:benzoyl-CoA reductase subunit C
MRGDTVIDELLVRLLADRLAAVERAKSEGVKVVGYLPGPYVPEELIYASGALPVCLAQGGNAQPAEHALSLLPPIICPFARAQVGEMLLKKDPMYSAIDMLVVPSTCQHLRKTGDIWEYYEPIDVFKLGVPYDLAEALALGYYRNRLLDLKDRLETLTGRTITDDDLGQAISVYDHLRQALKKLSLLRRSTAPAISGLEFVKLNHATLSGDARDTAEVLEAVYRERTGGAPHDATARPRLLITGPNLAMGDHAVVEMLENAGATVVIEEVFEGVRDYWCHVGAEGDPLDALVRAHLLDRVPAAFMRSSIRPRFELMSRLIRDFDVSGVVWYQLTCCEFYDQEAYVFENWLRRLGVPMLVLESNYDDMRSGAIRTRIEAFLEMVQGGPADA